MSHIDGAIAKFAKIFVLVIIRNPRVAGKKGQKDEEEEEEGGIEGRKGGLEVLAEGSSARLEVEVWVWGWVVPLEKI